MRLKNQSAFLKELILDITLQGCPCWCLHLSCLNSCLSYNPRVSSWYESWGGAPAWPVYGPEGAFITASATIHILHLGVLHLHLWSPGTKYVSSFVPCTSDKFASALEALLLLFSHSWIFVTPWIAACQAFLSSTVCYSFLKFMSIEMVMLSNHLILCHHPSHFCFSFSQNQGLFQWVSSSHQVAKVVEVQH